MLCDIKLALESKTLKVIALSDANFQSFKWFHLHPATAAYISFSLGRNVEGLSFRTRLPGLGRKGR